MISNDVETYKCWIDILNRQELLVHLMNLLVLKPAFFKISERKVQQCIST